MHDIACHDATSCVMLQSSHAPPVGLKPRPLHAGVVRPFVPIHPMLLIPLYRNCIVQIPKHLSGGQLLPLGGLLLPLGGLLLPLQLPVSKQWLVVV